MKDRLRGRGFSGQASGDTADELREWVVDVATIGDCDHACGDRAPCLRFDEVAAGERGGAGGDRGAGRELDVAGLDELERAGQQRRRLPDVPGDDVDQRFRPRRAGLVFSAKSARTGPIEDLAGLPQVPHHHLGAGRLEQPLGRPLPVRGELGGAPQVHRGGRGTSSLPGALCRRLQRLRHLFIGAGRSSTEVPRTPVGVGLRIERSGERGMGAAPIRRCGRVVDRRADEGMAELDGRGEPNQATPLCLRDRLVP